MLHNFIYGKSKNARRKGKASIFVSSPQPTVLSSRSSTRPRSPSSPASFASPEIFDIHERDHGSFDYVPRAFQVPDDDQMYDSYEESDNEHRQSEKHKPSPKVQLEFDSEPPLSEIFSQAMRGEGTEMLTSSGSGSGSGDGSGSRAAALSEEQLVIEPTGTNTTNFIDYSDDEKPRRNGLTTGPSYRKPPPAPIQIPEHAMKGPQVHVQHTASLKSSDQNNSTDRNAGPSDSRDAYLSRPPSTMSTDEFSAVSGTTLARALIANSFILSSDPRASRHRSGVMRQDSATLPRGESPMLNSPYWRDRRVSTSSMVMTPDTGRTSPIPPVPPMPGFVKGASASGNAATLARRRSTSAASLQEEMGAGLVRSSSTHSRLEVGEYQASRRISRISEAPSPAPSAPSTPQRTPLSGRSINGEQSSIVSPSLRRTSPSPTFETEQEQHMQSTGADRDSVSTEGVEREHTPDRESTTPVQEQEMEVPDGPLSGTGSVAISEGPLSDDSGTDIRNLLQNYQFVSPLPSATSDQSASATAPPSPLSNTAPTKRSSKKIRSGKVILPTGPSGRLDWGNRTDSRVLGGSTRVSTQQNANRSLALLPIGERPHSLHVPHSPHSPGAATSEPKITSSTIRMSSISQLAGSVPNSATSVKSLRPSTAPRTDSSTPTSPDILDGMLAPATRGIFVRQRSGSTPNPITVVRDAKMRAYSIAVSESPMSSSATSPPTSGTQQTFPETPDAFSPMWSAGPGQTMPAESAEPEPAPPSSRPNSGPSASSRIMLGPRTNPTSTAPGTKESTLSPIGEDGESTAASNGTSQYPLSAFMADYEHSPPVPLSVMKDLPNVPPPTPPAFVQSKETSEGRPMTAPTRRSPDIEVDTVQANARKPSGPSELAPPASTALSAPSTSTSFVPPPAPPPLPSAPPPSRSPPPPPRARSPQPSLAPSSASFSPSYVAPPPYQAAVSSPPSQPNSQTPSPGSDQLTNMSSPPTTADTPVQASNGPVKLGQGLPASSLGSISGSGRRPRTRPPLPIGPRKPSATGSSILVDGRARNGSVSSMASIRTRNESGEMSAGTWRTFSAGMTGPSPKFQTQPIKWRGYTMDAAIWTFTSHQLQSIVSRAIKQSAEASSIRLLRLETLDNEVPEELHRLDMLRMDIRTRYKAMTRKRWSLIGSLSALVDGEQPGDPASALRLVEQLADMSNQLDQLAEELHSVTDQIAQLKSLRDVHSASALAMALRKLNSSFLSKATENNLLRERISALEAERDQAWKQAEDVAHDFDDLNEKLVDACPDIGSQTRSARSSTSLRSHRVSAVRKSSLRASKAGLHSASRRSQRISVASTRNSSIPSSAGMPDSIIPPVPPMPRPLGIVTSGLPTRHSVFASSVTPTSETRAMVHAQDELYAMLGIRMDQEPKSWRLTRTRSMSMSAGPVSAQSRRASTAVTRPLSDSLSPGFHSATGFRSSSP